MGSGIRVSVRTGWLAVWALVPGLSASVYGAEALHSPDGAVEVTVTMAEGAPRWTVCLAGRPIIQDGLLGIETTPESVDGPYRLLGAERSAHDGAWKALWGNLSTVPDRWRQLTLKLQETGSRQRLLNLILRAYDEGVGLRYEFPQQPDLTAVSIKGRRTEFRFTDNHVIYDNRKYSYGTGRIDSLTVKAENNVTVDVGQGAFVSLTDADRSDYSQAFWIAKKGTANTIVDSGPPVTGTTPFTTSWEVVIIGRSLGGLYENRHIVDNLNPPCAIADTSWIRPGKAICQIRNGAMVDADMRKLLDFASAHRIEYMEIDHSWNGAETRWTAEEIASFDRNKKDFWVQHPEWRQNVMGNPMVAAKGYVPFRPTSVNGGNLVDLDMPALTAYGKKLHPPVGVCVYVRGELFKEFGGEHPIDTVFAAYEKMGIAGVKPGFVPAGSQYNERTIAYLVKTAAEHHLILTIHDSYYPYGLSRTYPNLLNIEGGAGEEAEHSIPPELKSIHDVMLTFTRFLMGPFDYTPEIGLKSVRPKTHCHQVAMLGVWYGRPSIRGGMRQWSPGGENSGGEIAFVERLPALFDEMRVTAEANRSVTVARRAGDAWYVASMSGAKAESYAYPLGFLAPGRAYRATIFSDTPGKLVTTRAQQEVTAATVIPLAMAADGGHLMIIEPLP